MRRPVGRAPLQYRHCSPACGTIVCAARDPPVGVDAARGPVVTLFVVGTAGRRGACAATGVGAVAAVDAPRGAVVADGARAVMRCVVSVADALPAPTSISCSAAAGPPAPNRRMAAGE